MRKIIESLKRLYKAGKITKTQVAERLAKGTISSDEYLEIVGE